MPSGSPAEGGDPGERERAARVRDLSEEAPHSAGAPPPPVLYVKNTKVWNTLGDQRPEFTIQYIIYQHYVRKYCTVLYLGG